MEESKYGALFADETDDFNEIVRQYEAAYKQNPELDIESSAGSPSSSGKWGLNFATLTKGAALVGVAVLVMMAVVSSRGGASDQTSDATVYSAPSIDIPVTPVVEEPVYIPEPVAEPVYEPEPVVYEPIVVEPEPAPEPVYVPQGPQYVTPDADISAEVINHAYPDNGNPKLPYPFLQGSLLMEPYRQSTVYVSGIVDSCNVQWTVTGTDSRTESYSWTGTVTDKDSETGSYVFAVMPKKTGQYTLSVSEECADGLLESPRSYQQTIWVKYVRREISNLNGADREEFLDALRTLWDVNTKDGQALYGDKYKSLNYLAVLHNDGTGNGVCDEFATGAGFVNNQVLLSMYLEQSLRLVNPRVSLHYMEYSKYFESDEFKARASNVDGGAWNQLMSEKYFGINDPATGQILDSRWAGSKIPYLDSEFFSNEMIDESTSFFPDEQEAWSAINPPHITSPYGLLRSPWNYNPNAYLTRFNNVAQIEFGDLPEASYNMYNGATCADYQTFIENYVNGQPLQVLLEGMETAIATKFYYSVGGAGGTHSKNVDDALKSTYSITDEELLYITRGGDALYKNYIPRKNSGNDWYPLECSFDPWQDGTLLTTAAPGVETDGIKGPFCQCNPYYAEYDRNLTALIGLWNLKDSKFLYEFEPSERFDVMNLLCGRMVYDGELASSASAMDPLFWASNGALERIYQRALLGNILSDKTYANSKRNECSGHTADGKKAWLKGLYFEDESIDPSALSNFELAEYLDPSNDKYRDNLNYVYEDASWSWCDGFDSWFSDVPLVTYDIVSVYSSTLSTGKGTKFGDGAGKPMKGSGVWAATVATATADTTADITADTTTADTTTEEATTADATVTESTEATTVR